MNDFFNLSVHIIIMIKNNAQHLLNVGCSSEAVHIKSRNLHTNTVHHRFYRLRKQDLWKGDESHEDTYIETLALPLSSCVTLGS